MATEVAMIHKDTGVTKQGYFGYSWTTLLFGPLPALFRGDFLTFLGYFAVGIIIGFVTLGVGWFVIFIIWSFMYNSFYTKKLLEKGYIFNGSEGQNAEAAQALGVVVSKNQVSKEFAQQASAQAPAERKCPYCAEMVKAEAKICRFCQRDLPFAAEAAEAATAAQLAVAQEAANAEERRVIQDLKPKGTCPRCNTTLALDSLECPECNAHFGPGAVWKIKPL